MVEHLVRDKGFPPACMAAMGFGEFQPVCTEATAECRAKNRRVVFLVKNPALSGTRECAAVPSASPKVLRQEGEDPGAPERQPSSGEENGSPSRAGAPERQPRPREEPPS